MLGRTKPWDYGKLSISPDKRFFVNGSTSFFWLGDTAWDLMQRLSEEESRLYLDNRALKGFTVIQSVLINFKDTGGKVSNQKFEDCDIRDIISAKNTPYWQHVDQVIAYAEESGLYMALLPVWGKVLKAGYLTEENMPAYADFLAERYKNRPNILWLLGGDIRGDLNFDLWDRFGRRLKKHDPDRLIGYHPFGRTSSSYWFNDCDWLDFHMFQSGHRRYDQKIMNAWDEANDSEPWYGEDNWRYLRHDRSLDPPRPVLDGEPSYEEIPQGLHDPSEPYWQSGHVRRYAYWSLLSGAAGHTYGHNSIFQFWGKGYAKEFGARDPWQDAIHHDGSAQMGIMKKILEDFNFQEAKPSPFLISDQGEREAYIPVLAAEDRLLAYIYTGRSFSLKTSKRAMELYWINPENGVCSYAGQYAAQDSLRLRPPQKKSAEKDYLLYAVSCRN